MTVGYAEALRNARLDEVTARAGGGALLQIYDGTRPATGAAVTDQTLLAQLTCGTPFAGAASGGQLTANAVTQDSSADDTGTATWWRVFQSDGTTFAMDGDAGESGSGAELILDDADIVAGGTVAVNSFVITAGNA